MTDDVRPGLNQLSPQLKLWNSLWHRNQDLEIRRRDDCPVSQFRLSEGRSGLDPLSSKAPNRRYSPKNQNLCKSAFSEGDLGFTRTTFSAIARPQLISDGCKCCHRTGRNTEEVTFVVLVVRLTGGRCRDRSPGEKPTFPNMVYGPFLLKTLKNLHWKCFCMLIMEEKSSSTLFKRLFSINRLEGSSRNIKLVY